MDIHIIDSSNRHLYEALLDENFRRRAEIFVRELKWRALREDRGRELDRFDTSAATHYLAVEDGRIVGGARRHSSLGPTLISEVFPHLAERGFERAADVYEGTRVYVVPERRTERPSKIAGLMHWAVWAHTLAQGGRAINLVTYASFVPHMARMGLRPRPLGLPAEHDGMHLMAVSTAVDATVLEELMTFYDILSVPFVTTGVPARATPRRVA